MTRRTFWIRPPYRPIVSSKRTLTEHISEYVDNNNNNGYF